MLRYSYKVLLKEYETKLLGLKLDLIRNPNNNKIIKLIDETKKSIDWIQQQIVEGKDPGCIIL